MTRINLLVGVNVALDGTGYKVSQDLVDNVRRLVERELDAVAVQKSARQRAVACWLHARGVCCGMEAAPCGFIRSGEDWTTPSRLYWLEEARSLIQVLDLVIEKVTNEDTGGPVARDDTAALDFLKDLIR